MGVLTGVRVIEVSGSAAGQIAGMLLADWGADVIRLEGDEAAALRAEPTFAVWNRNKRSAVREPTVLERLLADADVLLFDEAVEPFDEHLRNRHPELVTTVLRDTDAVDVAHAVCGLMRTHLCATDPDRPVYHVAPAAAYGAALLAVEGTLAALFRRRAGGSAGTVETSALQGALVMLQFSIGLSDDRGRDGIVATDGDPYAVTGPLVHFYKAAGGRWLFIGAPTPAIWVRLCTALDRFDLVADPAFEAAPFGIEPAEARMRLVRELGRTIAEWDVDELTERLNDEGIVAAPSLLPEQFLALQDMREGDRIVTVDTPGLGPVTQVAPGFTFSAHEPSRPRPVSAAAPDLDWKSRGRPVDGSAGAGPMAARPLDGITVLDFASFVAGPLAARHLAELGARVVKVEMPGGDALRQLGYTFAASNWGKEELEADLSDPDGRRSVDELLRTADIVIHNLRPSLQARTGISWERISALNPRAIVARIGGWAADGPLSERRAIDGAFQAVTGACVGQGGDVEPRGFYGGFVDNATAVATAAACVAALVDRQSSGRGQHVTTTLLSTAAFIQSHRLVAVGDEAPPHGRLGSDPLGPAQLARLFAVTDGWIYVDARAHGAWERLVADGRVAGPARPADDDDADAIADGPVARALGEWCATMSADEAIVAWRDLGAAAAAVHHIRELPLLPELVDSGMVAPVEHPTWGRLWLTGELVRLR